MSEDTRNETRDANGNVVQARDITGIVNVGGYNRCDNVAIGEGATINNYGDRDNDTKKRR